jgi:hypothetical protein
MKIVIALICMMVSAYAQPINDKLRKDIENMDQIERTSRMKPPHKVRGR